MVSPTRYWTLGDAAAAAPTSECPARSRYGASLALGAVHLQRRRTVRSPQRVPRRLSKVALPPLETRAIQSRIGTGAWSANESNIPFTGRRNPAVHAGEQNPGTGTLLTTIPCRCPPQALEPAVVREDAATHTDAGRFC